MTQTPRTASLEQIEVLIKRGLPAACYTVITSAEPGDRIGVIKRGESGYYLTDLDCASDSMVQVETMVDMMNERLALSDAQVEAMKVGSMFGWFVPGADPAMHPIGRVAAPVVVQLSGTMIEVPLKQPSIDDAEG